MSPRQNPAAAGAEKPFNGCACGGTWCVQEIGIESPQTTFEVCRRVFCSACGKTRKITDSAGKKAKDIFFTVDCKNIMRDYKNFNVPRELCEEPIYDSSGAPLFNQNGTVKKVYSEDLKINFVKKLLSLADETYRGLWQGFKLRDIMAARPLPEEKESGIEKQGTGPAGEAS